MADEYIDPATRGFPADNRDGTPGLIGPDEHTRSLIRARADKVSGANVAVGNYADLQRLGADAAQGVGTAPKAIATAPGVDIKNSTVISPAQAEAAKGEYTRETERAGLLDAPTPATPAENREPNPVDPGSVSPTTEAKGSSTIQKGVAK